MKNTSQIKTIFIFILKRRSIFLPVINLKCWFQRVGKGTEKAFRGKAVEFLENILVQFL